MVSIKEDTLNHEAVGFAIGFKKADAKELLAMGQWEYFTFVSCFTMVI